MAGARDPAVLQQAVAAGQVDHLLLRELGAVILGAERPAADHAELRLRLVGGAQPLRPAVRHQVVVVDLREVRALRLLPEPVGRTAQAHVLGAVMELVDARVRRERAHDVERLGVVAVVPDPDAHRVVAGREQALEREPRVGRAVVGDHQDVDVAAHRTLRVRVPATGAGPGARLASRTALAAGTGAGAGDAAGAGTRSSATAYDGIIATCR